MSRSVQKVGNLIETEFTVYDDSDQPVTGLLNVDFQKFLSVNGASSAIPVTVSEIGSGRYETFFTPSVIGDWYLLIRQTTYNLRGWDESFDVNQAGSDIYSFKIDDFTLSEVLELIGAILCGNVSGGSSTPVFKSMDGSAIRVTAVADSSGNRTVTLTP